MSKAQNSKQFRLKNWIFEFWICLVRLGRIDIRICPNCGSREGRRSYVRLYELGLGFAS